MIKKYFLILINLSRKNDILVYFFCSIKNYNLILVYDAISSETWFWPKGE